MNSSRLIFSLLTVSMLTACITETTGRSQTSGTRAEASDLNAQLGSEYLRKGDWLAAQAKLEKSVEQDPDNIIAQRLLGFAYENLGDYEGAERHYRRAVSLAPHDPEALNGLAVFLCRDENSVDEAMKYFNRALSVPLSKAFSNKAAIYTNAGVCMKRRDLALAEDYLRKALAVNQNYAEALLQITDVTYQLGNYLQSRAFLQRHLTVAAPSPDALWLGVRVENALGDFKAADTYGNQLRAMFPESVETRQLLEQLSDTG